MFQAEKEEGKVDLNPTRGMLAWEEEKLNMITDSGQRPAVPDWLTGEGRKARCSCCYLLPREPSIWSANPNHPEAQRGGESLCQGY